MLLINVEVYLGITNFFLFHICSQSIILMHPSYYNQTCHFPFNTKSNFTLPTQRYIQNIIIHLLCSSNLKVYVMEQCSRSSSDFIFKTNKKKEVWYACKCMGTRNSQHLGHHLQQIQKQLSWHVYL